MDIDYRFQSTFSTSYQLDVTIPAVSASWEKCFIPSETKLSDKETLLSLYHQYSLKYIYRLAPYHISNYQW